MISVIITYLVAFSATNLHIYHKVAVGHLMQAWARFALQCFSFYLYWVLVIVLNSNVLNQDYVLLLNCMIMSCIMVYMKEFCM